MSSVQSGSLLRAATSTEGRPEFSSANSPTTGQALAGVIGFPMRPAGDFPPSPGSRQFGGRVPSSGVLDAPADLYGLIGTVRGGTFGGKDCSVCIPLKKGTVSRWEEARLSDVNKGEGA